MTSRIDIVAHAFGERRYLVEYATRRCFCLFLSVIGRCKNEESIQRIAHICHIFHNIVISQ